MQATALINCGAMHVGIWLLDRHLGPGAVCTSGHARLCGEVDESQSSDASVQEYNISLISIKEK